jgi:hypothetical protein
MDEEPCRLLQVQDESEGDDVCGRLRAAGIKCAVEPLPDPNSLGSFMGGMAATALFVLVNESDASKARSVLAGS